jgi:hypothetical protein
MVAIINAFCGKLTNKLLFADSHDEMQTFIYTAVKELKEHKVHNYIIRRLLDKTIVSLEDMKPCDNNSQQHTNIKMNKIVLTQFKTFISQVVSWDSNKNKKIK